MPIHRDTQGNRLPSHGAGARQASGSPTRGIATDRARLRANGLSAVAVLALLLIGGWAENGLVNATRDSRDCYRPGRSDCAAVYIPAPPAALTHGS
jgi:hypothetical protein